MAARTSASEIRYWQQHVEAYNASGLTREAYSQKNRIQVYRLDYWRRKISRISRPQERVPANRWLPVRISDETPYNDAHIDLWIGPIRVEVKRGFDPKLLAELLRTVGAAC